MIATNGTATYALFLYVDIIWTADILGGVAQVGFNKGDGSNYLLPSIANLAALSSTSNVVVPGLYVYRIDGANINAGPGIYNGRCHFERLTFHPFRADSILYPYGVAARDASLPRADESSVLVSLLQPINLYGRSVSSVYVRSPFMHPCTSNIDLFLCHPRSTPMVSYRPLI